MTVSKRIAAVDSRSGTSFSICGVYDLERELHLFRPDLILSVQEVSGNDRLRAKSAIKEYVEDNPAKVISAAFHDIDRLTTGLSAPSVGNISPFLGPEIRAFRGKRILAHCHAGMSRSPAVMMGAMGLILDDGRPMGELEADIRRMILETSPFAIPNTRILEIAQLWMRRIHLPRLGAEIRAMTRPDAEPINIFER